MFIDLFDSNKTIPECLAIFPMTKVQLKKFIVHRDVEIICSDVLYFLLQAAKRGLDTIHNVAKEKMPSLNITKFSVQGASKVTLAFISKDEVGLTDHLMVSFFPERLDDVASFCCRSTSGGFLSDCLQLPEHDQGSYRWIGPLILQMCHYSGYISGHAAPPTVSGRLVGRFLRLLRAQLDQVLDVSRV